MGTRQPSQGKARAHKPDAGPKPERPVLLPDRWGLKQRILHDAEGVICLNKPAGLPLDGGKHGQESLEDWLPQLGKHPAKPPRPAHRLDQDTSGCLLLARTPGALRHLQAAFAAHTIGKIYWAWVDGAPPKAEGDIHAPLAKRSSAARGWRMVVDGKGQPSQTHYRILARQDGRTLVELTPTTGRTHQLRVHMAHLGCPLAGDVVYGRSDGPLRLHARTISFRTGLGTLVVVEAPLPADWPKS